MNSRGAAGAITEWKQGGAMVFAAMIGLATATFPLSMIGVLVKPLGLEFGWSRAAVSGAFFITACGTLLLAPVVGPLVDRIGPRRVALGGLVAAAIGSMCIGLAGSSIYSWYLCWAIYAVLQAFANGVVWSNAIVTRFDKNRGTALGLFLTGLALCNGLGPMFAVFTMTHLGWRAIFFIIAAMMLLVAWPLAWRFFYGASDLDRVRGVVPAASEARRASVLESMRHRAFWHIAIAFPIAAAAIGALMVHLQPILTDTGVSPAQAALVAFAIGPAAIAGRLLCGILLDIFPGNVVAAIALLLPGVAYAILMGGDVSITSAYLCAIFIGVAGGAETDMLAYLVSRYFAPRLYSSTYAVMLGLYGVGFGLAPVIAGAVFDATNSYRPIFIFLVSAALLGAALMAALGRPRGALAGQGADAVA